MRRTSGLTSILNAMNPSITHRQIRIDEIVPCLIEKEKQVYPRLTKDQKNSLYQYVVGNFESVQIYEMNGKRVGVCMYIPMPLDYLENLISNNLELKLKDIPEVTPGEEIGIYILHIHKETAKVKGFIKRVLTDLLEEEGKKYNVTMFCGTAVTQESQDRSSEDGFELKNTPFGYNTPKNKYMPGKVAKVKPVPIRRVILSKDNSSWDQYFHDKSRM